MICIARIYASPMTRAHRKIRYPSNSDEQRFSSCCRTPDTHERSPTPREAMLEPSIRTTHHQGWLFRHRTSISRYHFWMSQKPRINFTENGFGRGSRNSPIVIATRRPRSLHDRVNTGHNWTNQSQSRHLCPVAPIRNPPSTARHISQSMG